MTTKSILTGCVAIVMASLAQAAGATAYTMNLTQDLGADWFFNPSYGTSVISSNRVSLPSPIVLQAGDQLTVDVSFLPGQQMLMTNTGGSWREEFNFQGFENGNPRGPGGTFTASLKGVSGDAVTTSGSGTLNGGNFLFLDMPSNYTDSTVGFTGLHMVIDVTDVHTSFGPSATPFSLDSYFFQVYGDSLAVVLDSDPADVPEPAMLGLFGLGALGLGLARRRSIAK